MDNLGIGDDGFLSSARKVLSPNFDDRPVNEDICLLVIHGISLPPGEYGNSCIEHFFCNNLDVGVHPYFSDIAMLKVSSHVLIKRDGSIVQFVSFDKRAWHAGQSEYLGRSRCNDFAIGIELEGTDSDPYSADQYDSLVCITKTLISHYPNITKDTIVGHKDIAPGRKTDPGDSFDWKKYFNGII